MPFISVEWFFFVDEYKRCLLPDMEVEYYVNMPSGLPTDWLTVYETCDASKTNQQFYYCIGIVHISFNALILILETISIFETNFH